ESRKCVRHVSLERQRRSESSPEYERGWRSLRCTPGFRLGHCPRCGAFFHREKQLPVFACPHDARQSKGHQYIQDIKSRERGGDVPRASCYGHDVFCRHPSRSAHTPLHVVHGVRVDYIEVTGAAPRLRERKRKHEEIALGLEDMVGL